MTNSKRIYMDNAATSWPKPPQVIDALSKFYEEIGSSAGRGNGKYAIAAKDLIESARGRVCDLIHAGNSRQILFETSGTAALNQAILGLLEPGDHVVTTRAEHNSVLRPLKHLESTQMISVDRVTIDHGGLVNPDDIRSALRDETRLIVVTHASNVTGAIQPVNEIGGIASEREIVFMVDAAQTLGHLPIDVNEIGCQLLAAPGHKNLLGPLGTGVLYVHEEIIDRITPIQFGGTGTESESDSQPNEYPSRFESGNINSAAIAGMAAGIEFLASEQGIKLRSDLGQLTAKMLEELLAIEGITVYGPENVEDRVSVVSLNIDGVDCRDASAMLESSYSIETRAGFHCAPLIHASLQSESTGGTVRISLGLFNTEEEMNTLVDAVKEIAAANIF